MTQMAKPHGFVTRGIHWVSAALIGFGYVKGLDDVSQLAHPGAMQLEVLYALGLGVLFVLRFVWTRYVAGPTRLPDTAPAWEHTLAKGVHVGLYASVFGIVLSGLTIAWAYAMPGSVLLAGAIALHEAFLVLLPLLLLAHIAGALWHRVVRRDGVLESMTGRFSKA